MFPDSSCCKGQVYDRNSEGRLIVECKNARCIPDVVFSGASLITDMLRHVRSTTMSARVTFFPGRSDAQPKSCQGCLSRCQVELWDHPTSVRYAGICVSCRGV